MPDKDGGVLDGLPSTCGHRNPPSAFFCDVCGVKLPVQCPRCSAINRSQANFCSHCGLRLYDLQETYAPPSAGPFGQSPDSPPALESVPALPVSPDRVSWTALSIKPAVADDSAEAERLNGIVQFIRRRRRRARVWLGAAGLGIVTVLLGAALVRTHMATLGAAPPPGTAVARDQSATRAETSGSAAIAQSTPASGGPTAVQPGSLEGSRAPAAPDKSPAVASALPRAGGELQFVVASEPPSYDAHREETFALMHPAAPHYNTLLRIDPLDPAGTRVVGDLATSWTVSSDKRTYVLRLRRGVKFHDGSEMTSRDVRATYEKIINPPPGITSARKGEYLQIETVQAPEPYVVAFKLKWPSPSFIHSLASPWNWIYKADILERDVRWYEKNVMGTGPFVFVEHVKGTRWVGRRNPDYWDRGKPYLDGYQALFIPDDAAQVTAIRSGHAHIQFRGFSPAQRDDLVRALPGKITVQESPWNCGLVVAINHDKEPFNDPGVRRALSLALDRYRAASVLSQTAIVREVAGVQVPGSLFATPPAELMKLAGYSRDIRESRF